MKLEVELRRLAALRLPQLRVEYERVVGEPARSNNKIFLIKRTAWHLQAAAEGGLSERARARAVLLARDADLRVRPRPEVHAAYAAMPVARTPASPAMVVGSLVSRRYKGQTILVRVVQGGFEFGGEVFASLTAVAKRVTGSNWNGRLFFGLTKRGRGL